MTQSPTPARPARALTALALVASGAASAIVGAFGYAVGSADEARATALNTTADTDLDGLVDVFESIIGTDLGSADTDADGLSDAEEIARQSDARDPQSLPSSNTLSIGQAAFVANDQLRLVTLIYLPYAVIDWSALDLRLGLKTSAGQIELPPEVYVPLTTLKVLPGAAQGSLLLRLESSIAVSVFQGIGPFALYATLTDQPGTGPKTAAATNLEPVAGVLAAVEQTASSVVAPRNYSSGNGSGPSISVRPIVVADEVPVAFTIGEICLQSTTEVGYANGVVELLIDASSCEPADAYCSPGCPFEVGNTKELVDPLALIGG